MVFLAPSFIFPISAMTPSLTATSAMRRGAPVPSTTVPFLISKSYDMMLDLVMRAAGSINDTGLFGLSVRVNSDSSSRPLMAFLEAGAHPQPAQFEPNSPVSIVLIAVTAVYIDADR